MSTLSRAHEIEIRPSSFRVANISELNARVSFKFWSWLPLVHTLRLFWKFGNLLLLLLTFQEYLSFSLTWKHERHTCYRGYCGFVEPGRMYVTWLLRHANLQQHHTWPEIPTDVMQSKINVKQNAINFSLSCLSRLNGEWREYVSVGSAKVKEEPRVKSLGVYWPEVWF